MRSRQRVEGPVNDGDSRWRGLDLLVVGLAVCGALVLYCTNWAGIVGLYNDDSMYALAAKSLLERVNLLETQAWHSPLARFPIGYPAILAALGMVSGRDYTVVATWEFFTTLTTAAFLIGAYLLLTRAWRFHALIAGSAVVIVAYHPLTIKYGAAIMSDFLAALMSVGCLATVEWGMRRPGSPLPIVVSGIALGLTLLVRYAALPVAIAAFVVLWLAGRRTAAMGLAAVATVTVSPWAVWVIRQRAFDYAVQYSSGPDPGIIGNVARSANWLVLESLPGLLLPAQFLHGLGESVGPTDPPGGVLAVVALIVTAALTGNLFAALGRPSWRLPALASLLTLALVLLWSGPFTYLSWDLQVRLLLPVAPFILAIAINAAWRQIRALAFGRRFAVIVLCMALLAAQLPGHARAIRAGQSYNMGLHEHLGGLLAARAYLERIPRDVILGAPYPHQAYFYLDRPFTAVKPSAIDLMRAQRDGVRIVLGQPFQYAGSDLMWQAVKMLQNAKPPRARILYVAARHLAVVHLIDVANQPAPSRPTSQRLRRSIRTPVGTISAAPAQRPQGND